MSQLVKIVDATTAELVIVPDLCHIVQALKNQNLDYVPPLAVGQFWTDDRYKSQRYDYRQIRIEDITGSDPKAKVICRVFLYDDVGPDGYELAHEYRRTFRTDELQSGRYRYSLDQHV